jgi:hypothetical protein
MNHTDASSFIDDNEKKSHSEAFEISIRRMVMPHLETLIYEEGGTGYAIKDLSEFVTCIMDFISKNYDKKTNSRR